MPLDGYSIQRRSLSLAESSANSGITIIFGPSSTNSTASYIRETYSSFCSLDPFFSASFQLIVFDRKRNSKRSFSICSYQ
jgi:hypothetical protein